MKKVFSLLLALTLLTTSLIGGFVVKAEVDPGKLSYNFDIGTQGWFAPKFMVTAGQLSVNQENGALKCKMLTGWRAITVEAYLNREIDGNVHNTLHLRIKNPTPSTQAQMGFGYASDPNMDNLEMPEYNFQFTISANDTEYKDYYINLGKYQSWISKNDINFFRVQLGVDIASINQSMYIDTVEFYNKNDTPAPIVSYNFDNSNQNWEAPYFIVAAGQLAITQESGALKCQMLTGWRIITVQTYLNSEFDGGVYDTIHLRIKNPTSSTQAKIGFGYASDSGMTNLEAADYNYQITISGNDTEYKDYYINVGKYQSWVSKNDINFLRVQLGVDVVSLNQSIYIDTIELYNKYTVPTPKVIYNYDNDTQNWNAPLFMVSGGQLSITQESGALKCHMLTGWRPITVQASLNYEINGSVYDTVHLRIKNPTASTQAKLGFGYASDPTGLNLDVPEYNFSFNITANDTDYKDYYINLSKYQTWASKVDINFLKLALCFDVISANQSVYIDEIELYNMKEAPVAPEILYNYDNDVQNWAAPYYTISGGMLVITQENGALACQMLTGWKPITVQTDLDRQIDGTIYNAVHIRIKNPTASTQVQLGFGYASDPTMANLDDPAYNIPFTISANDTEYKDYYINIGNNSNWASKYDINFLRVQLALDVVSANQFIYIDSIKVYQEALPVISGVTEGETTGKVTVSFNEGSALLNGASFTSGAEVNKTGSYTLVVTDALNNSKMVHFTVIIYGDVDGDGNTDLEDLVSVRNHLLEITPLSGAFRTAGDLYEEGNVTLNDLVAVMAYVSESGTINQK